MTSKTQKQDTVVREDEVVKPIELANAAEVRPQMVYNYIRNGMIEAFEGQILKVTEVTETDEEGNESTTSVEEPGRVQLLIRREVAEEWLEGYTTRKAEREARKAAEAESTEAVEVTNEA